MDKHEIIKVTHPTNIYQDTTQ